MAYEDMDKGFEWALSEMKKGGKVARASWGGGKFAKIRENQEGPGTLVFIQLRNGYSSPWIPHSDDLSAENWGPF